MICKFISTSAAVAAAAAAVFRFEPCSVVKDSHVTLKIIIHAGAVESMPGVYLDGFIDIEHDPMIVPCVNGNDQMRSLESQSHQETVYALHVYAHGMLATQPRQVRLQAESRRVLQNGHGEEGIFSSSREACLSFDSFTHDERHVVVEEENFRPGQTRERRHRVRGDACNIDDCEAALETVLEERILEEMAQKIIIALRKNIGQMHTFQLVNEIAVLNV